MHVRARHLRDRIILDVAGFLEKALPGQVPGATLDRLTLIDILVDVG